MSGSKQQQQQKVIKNRPRNLEMYSLPITQIDITESALYKEADIINLHWVANFVDYESFFRKNKKPIVWTLHDMNPFLGIDHYNEDFLGMDDNGMPIVRNLSEDEVRFNRKIAKYKSDCLKRVDKLVIVSPSQWLANEAAKSSAFCRRKIEVIPYGLNKQVFAPRSRSVSREILNLPIEKKIILFVADSVDNFRKGLGYLEKAVTNFDSDEYVLCAIGKGSRIKSRKNLIKLGEIKDERLMSVAYSAADVFVIPSLMDNFPNTVLESLMCGTPVIGFPVGGIPEMVKHQKNGLLTNEVSSSSLEQSINQFFKMKHLFDREKIRAMALDQYDEELQAGAYISLYKRILAQKE